MISLLNLRLNRSLAIVLALIAQMGCTSVPTNTASAWPANEIAKRNWQGRFSSITLPVAADGVTNLRDKESLSGKFNLSLYANDQVQLELSNPLGVAVARLSVRSGQALLQVANQPDRQTNDLDTLTEQAIGWRVPVDKMANWLEGSIGGKSGTAAKAGGAKDLANSATFDSAGRLTEAINAGWQLTVEAWRDDGKPQRMRLIWPMSPADAPNTPHTKVQLRLIVDAVAPVSQ